jgi:hypothetical protein
MRALGGESGSAQRAKGKAGKGFQRVATIHVSPPTIDRPSIRFGAR